MLTFGTWVLNIAIVKLSILNINDTNINIKDLTLGGSLFHIFLNAVLAEA